jgi:hypothetical protein
MAPLYNLKTGQTGSHKEVVEIEAASGAINIKSGVAVVTLGSAAALTLAAPLAGVDDGSVLTIVSTTAQAHTVTQTTPGFNGGGTASDVGTFGAAIGNSMQLVAYNGIWYTVALRNVTLA